MHLQLYQMTALFRLMILYNFPSHQHPVKVPLFHAIADTEDQQSLTHSPGWCRCRRHTRVNSSTYSLPSGSALWISDWSGLFPSFLMDCSFNLRIFLKMNFLLITTSQISSLIRWFAFSESQSFLLLFKVLLIFNYFLQILPPSLLCILPLKYLLLSFFALPFHTCQPFPSCSPILVFHILFSICSAIFSITVSMLPNLHYLLGIVPPSSQSSSFSGLFLIFFYFNFPPEIQHQFVLMGFRLKCLWAFTLEELRISAIMSLLIHRTLSYIVFSDSSIKFCKSSLSFGVPYTFY